MNDFDEDKIREAKERLRNKPTVSAWLFLLLMVVSVIGVIHNYYLIKENTSLKEKIDSANNTIFLDNLSFIEEPIIYDKLVFNRTIEQVEVFCYKNNNITDELNCINLSQKDNCQSEFDKCVEVARGLYQLNQEGVCLK